MIRTNFKEREKEAHCETCSYVEVFDMDIQFEDVVDLLKSNGWFITKDRGQYVHYCPDCTDKWPKVQDGKRSTSLT